VLRHIEELQQFFDVGLQASDSLWLQLCPLFPPSSELLRRLGENDSSHVEQKNWDVVRSQSQKE
jgi:hypothetical protein